MGFLPILCKILNTVCLGTGYKTNSKKYSSHCSLTSGYQLFTKDFFRLGQFSSVHHEFLCLFSVGISFLSLTVVVSCRADNSAPDFMGINSPYPTTNFSHNITLLILILSSCLDFSCCVLMDFHFHPLFFLKYSLMWSSPRERVE